MFDTREGSGMLLFIIAVAYMFPTVIAMARNHKNIGAILILNLFIGWTLLGWVGALVWAVTAQDEPVVTG